VKLAWYLIRLRNNIRLRLYGPCPEVLTREEFRELTEKDPHFDKPCALDARHRRHHESVCGVTWTHDENRRLAVGWTR
jgi:hypothetical protein